jgi:uncharacterized membrane protein
MEMKLNTKHIALISVFAALQAAVSRMPGIPVVGSSGKIEPTVILMPLIGIVLGPWVGALAAFVGNFIAWLIPTTSFFGLLMLPTVPIGVMASGALARSGKSGWKITAALLATLNLLWYFSPPGLVLPYYPALHLAALAIVLLLRGKIAGLIQSGERRKMIWGTAIASFTGMMANHMAGNLIFIASVCWFVQLKGIKDAITALGLSWLKSGLPKEDPTGLGAIFALALPLSIVERALMTAIAIPIAFGILYALRRGGVLSIQPQ